MMAPRSIKAGFQETMTGSETCGRCGGVGHTETKERGELVLQSRGGTRSDLLYQKVTLAARWATTWRQGDP